MIRAIARIANAVGLIVVDTTYTIGAGGNFAEPGDFSNWIAAKRIIPGVTVTASIASGTYTITEPVMGHVDGSRIVWTNSGLNGDPLTTDDFTDAVALFEIDSVLGVDADSRNAAIDACETILRAKYKVIFECGTVNPVQCDGKHSGDWTNCPVAMINTGSVSTAVSTGTDGAYGDGAGGVAIFPGSAFLRFELRAGSTNDGGVVTMNNCVFVGTGNQSQAGTEAHLATDFPGHIEARNSIFIGSGNYGYRANHAGSAWLDGGWFRGNRTAIQNDNPSVSRLSGCDIQYNWIGIAMNCGGTSKAQSLPEFLGDTLSATGDGTHATVTFDGDVVVPVGETISILLMEPTAYDGQHVVTASSAGSVSFASTATDSMTVAGNFYWFHAAILKNNARHQIDISNGGHVDTSLLDMASTATFPQNGVADQPPLGGIVALVSGSVDAENGATITGHGTDIVVTGSATVAATGATVGTATAGASTLPIGPGPDGVYRGGAYQPPFAKGADYTVDINDKWIFNNKNTADLIVTLPDATKNPGRELRFQNYVATATTSASANVVPKGGGSAGTAILPATDGAWAHLVSNNVSWVIMASGT